MGVINKKLFDSTQTFSNFMNYKYLSMSESLNRIKQLFIKYKFLSPPHKYSKLSWNSLYYRRRTLFKNGRFVLYTHPTLISESRRVTEFNWEKCIASPYNNCFSLALNGSKVPNYNVRVMKVSDAAYLRHHLVNYLQALLESWSGQRDL